MTVQKLANSPDTQAQAKQLSDAMAGWSKRMRAFVVWVKAQPVVLLEMNWQVPLEDAGPLNNTRKLEKIGEALVQQRSDSAKATITSAAQICKTSLIWVASPRMPNPLPAALPRASCRWSFHSSAMTRKARCIRCTRCKPSWPKPSAKLIETSTKQVKEGAAAAQSLGQLVGRFEK